MKGWGTVNKIKVLLAEGRGISEISRQLGIDRKTVRKYRDLSMEEIAKKHRESGRRRRNLDAYEKWLRYQVERMAEDGVINAQSLYDQLLELGYTGSARSVRRRVKSLRKKFLKKQRIYEPFETDAGQQAMVDLGEKRGVWIGGHRQVIYLLVMILSFSRKKYAEWSDRPVDTEMFIGFHQRAFQSLGGVPAEIVYDQSKLAVLSERYGEVEFNESFYRFSEGCRFKTYICHKFDPETKGKIESAIRYAKRGFLPGRRFESLRDLQHCWKSWLQEVGDRKVHETTGKPPLDLWKQERPYLKPFPDKTFEPPPAFRLQQVQRDGMVKVLGNRYSVPSSHHGRKVQVRISGEEIQIRTIEGLSLCVHLRHLGRGKRLKDSSHYAKEYSVSTEELTLQLMELLGGQADFVQTLRHNYPRHYREQCRQILRLANHHKQDLLQEAALRILHHQCVSYGNLKKTVLYVESCQELDQVRRSTRELKLALPTDLGLETRPAGYYDLAVGKEVM